MQWCYGQTSLQSLFSLDKDILSLLKINSNVNINKIFKYLMTFKIKCLFHCFYVIDSDYYCYNRYYLCYFFITWFFMLFMISTSLAQLIGDGGCVAFNIPQTSVKMSYFRKKRYKWHLMHIVLLLQIYYHSVCLWDV